MNSMKHSLSICDPVVDRQFQERIRRIYPQSFEFENKYVEHEVAHIGRVFDSGLCPIENKTVLEFGCNVGATSIVLAHYGARVMAADVCADSLELAKLNAQRYGSAESISFQLLNPGEGLPFAAESFDVITCNSVLEYVGQASLPAIQRELDRVLRPGGLLLVFGTSNRLWPMEMHSKQWLINYLPAALDPFIRPRHERGVSPWRLRSGFGSHYDDLLSGWAGACRYVELKRCMKVNGWRLKLLRSLAPAFAVSPLSMGLLFPYATVLLRKRAGGDSNRPPG
jgi:2-polyprenyl-3-methyl-5-hydroxy-6-metoxy-1,4-benzoquinol methylase